jgi:hypothetical protein
MGMRHVDVHEVGQVESEIRDAPVK